ncbi:NAD(P)-dependent dehydrogenase (short-subunit alcohol dehydrogenase family) [Neobacillus niacini]|uniref:SDR family oxidoreductase n=1 Tax=Neobacillus niacini TaxID=86668 RepID=UPI002782401A|nr:NAD(P)-dependent dehydrogenase (short-subunit alcohol dehydrogenase family) [Neobacillus niacini]
MKKSFIGVVQRKAIAALVPIGRIGEPEEVAYVVSFLLSDEASYLSQSIYTVDGGVTNY